jgi:hypothetical protein
MKLLYTPTARMPSARSLIVPCGVHSTQPPKPARSFWMSVGMSTNGALGCVTISRRMPSSWARSKTLALSSGEMCPEQSTRSCSATSSRIRSTVVLSRPRESVTVMPSNPSGMPDLSIGAKSASRTKCRAVMVGIHTTRPPCRTDSMTAYGFSPPTNMFSTTPP